MKRKSTDELVNILENTHSDKVADFVKEHKEEMYDENEPFGSYIREKLKEKGRSQKRAFLDADISDKYGYKLISGEKHTRERDVILRLCYASGLTLKETQTALKLYGMAELYPRLERDAYIMSAFNERPGSIIEVNSFLTASKMAPLKSSGVQE